jgi:tetratricopeptide (TPR) repeat protein
MGNNEVVGPFGSGTVFGAQAPPRPFIRANLALKASRTGQLLDELLAGVSRPGTPREWTGMEMFLKQQVRRDDSRMAVVYSHFERNLRDMVELGVRSGAKVLISTVGRNWRDCAPLASLHRADLAAGQQAGWEKLYQDGMEREQQGKHSEAAAQYEQALKLDDRFAELHFRLARCHAALGDREKARVHFDLACEYDTLRFRADNRINQVIRRVAAEQSGRGVRLADAEAALLQASADGVPGEEWFYEHVHLTFPANYLVARQLAEQIFQALPRSASAAAHSEGNHLLSLEECEQRLGFTDYDRLRMAEEMMRRISRPPFTQQLGHAAQLARREQIVAELRERERTNFAATTAIFRQALARRPNDWQLHDNFGGVLLDHADGSNAVVHWRRVTELLPHRLSNYDLAASVLIEQERFDEAASLCERALQIEPDYVEGLIDLGRVRLGQRRGEEAVALFQKCARLQPHAARVRNHLGLALLQLGRRTDAEAAFRAAVRLEPDFLPANLNLGSALLAQGKGVEAIAHYQGLLRESPSNRTVRTALAKALAQNQRLGEAVEQYAEQVRQQPENFEARYALANALLRANRLAEAGEQFAVAIRLRPDSPEARLNYGGVLARQGQTQTARSQFEEALRLNPDFAPAHLNLGMVLLEDGQWPGAIAHFRETLRLEPQNARARQLLESALERQKAGR